MKSIDISPFKVAPGKKFHLTKRPTNIAPLYTSKEDYQQQLEAHITEMSDIQATLYAQDQYAILMVFQGMDAAGKDGAIKHVISGVNPQGCEVCSFKQPSAEELDHDFLWRTTRKLPERGRIGIFNRSYYEEVLVVRVHPEFLKAQKLSGQDKDLKSVWKDRYTSINNLEKHLHHNGTRIVKFFLHLSKDEQRRRFLERIEDKTKNWKLSEADIRERKYWDQYMHAYEECLQATSTKHGHWYVVPADDKKNSRLIISQIIIDLLKSIKVRLPAVGQDKRAELERLKTLLQDNQI